MGQYLPILFSQNFGSPNGLMAGMLGMLRRVGQSVNAVFLAVFFRVQLVDALRLSTLRDCQCSILHSVLNT